MLIKYDLKNSRCIYFLLFLFKNNNNYYQNKIMYTSVFE